MLCRGARILASIVPLLLLAQSACARLPAEETDALTPAECACADVDEAEDDTVYGFGDFVTTDIDGNAADQTLFGQAKLTVLNVWSTDSPDCADQMRDFAVLEERYADRGIQVIGVVGDVSAAENGLREAEREKIRTALDTAGASYLQLLPSEDLQRLFLQYVEAYPTTVLIDTRGMIVGETYAGMQPADTWETLIDEYLLTA